MILGGFKMKTYQRIRLLINGVGLGILTGFIFGEVAGIFWFLGYTLAWAFSPKYMAEDLK